ncbi:MAG TPA: DUF6187 family protein [Pilimelia sp.]|nr:DUF6187 family protein [Pilimelia sp.]
MPDREEVDTRFSLPAVDDPAGTETGVILLGLDADRLLAGLGMATLADDPALVALAVDHARHDADARLSFAALIEAGARRWRSARPALASAALGTPTPASLRQAWTRTLRTLAGADPEGEAGPATRAYLAACWLRREDVDRCAAARAAPGEETAHVVPEVPAT